MTEGTQRRLAEIVSADVVGGDDQADRLLTALEDLLDKEET